MDLRVGTILDWHDSCNPSPPGFINPGTLNNYNVARSIWWLTLKPQNAKMGQLKARKKKMEKNIGNFGSALMIAFSFTFNPWLAIAGLACITIQTNKAKMHNLTVVNLVSIIGFIFQLAK